jgi:hypothetical protein
MAELIPIDVPRLYGKAAYLATTAEREVFAHDQMQPASSPRMKLVLTAAALFVAPAPKSK